MVLKRSLMAAALVLSGPAFGHAKLLSTLPAAAAQLQTAPKSLSLVFNENVRLAVLTLTAADGKAIPVTVDRSLPASPHVSIAVPPLAAGKYDVKWSALSPDDGHVTKGEFSFVILPADRTLVSVGIGTAR